MLQMNKAKDIDLVAEVKQSNCNDSVVKLFERHKKLCMSIIYKLSKRFNTYMLLDELKDEMHHTIYLSAKKYDPLRSTKFSTFLANEMKWAFFNKMNKLIKNQNHIKLNDFIGINQEDQKDQTSESIYNISMDMLNNIHDVRVIKIFKLRYHIGKSNSNKVMPWHEVGTVMGLSSQGCINLHSIGIKFIKEKLKQEGIKNVK